MTNTSVHPGRAGRSLRSRLVRAAIMLSPVLELAVLIAVGSRIGAWLTLLLLLAGAAAGTIVLRRVGLAAARRLTTPTASPAGLPAADARPAAEAALVALAGLLLIVPGFLSDVVALALLVPAVRQAAARRVGDALARRVPIHSVRVVQGQVVEEQAAGDRVVDGVVISDVTVTDLGANRPRLPSS